jgi:hypothetical protein
MTAFVGWVELAIPIDAQACPLLGIAALHPTYESTTAHVLSVGCAVRTMVIAIGAHNLGGPAALYGGIA